MIRRALPILLLLAVAACGQKIGDSCTLSSDCSSDNTRVCDSFSRGGYCTIQGCDFGTCPSEAVCIRFFPTIFGNTNCTDNSQCASDEVCTSDGLCIPASSACSGQQECASDEFCTVVGACAPRSIEQRFCMLRCGSNDDCRDGYECRTIALMKEHGGQPVPDPNSTSMDVPNEPFCAPLRTCGVNADCNPDEVCSASLRVCVRQ